MVITNIFTNTNKEDRMIRQAELHRKCILILQSSADRGE